MLRLSLVAVAEVGFVDVAVMQAKALLGEPDGSLE